jgi:hypothetical protein
MKRPMLLLALAALLGGCTTQVPPGYVGMVLTPNGFEGDILQPGNHACWGRDTMVFVEMKEETIQEPMNILCKDDLNFQFHLNVRARLRIASAKDMKAILNRKGSDIQVTKIGRVLSFAALYKTYINPVARSVARSEVSKYETTAVRDHRAEIEKVVLAQLIKAVEGTPLEVVTVSTSNFDYPDVITKAVEKKRTREIELQEEKAKQAMELLRADNRLKIAEKMKIVKAAEAEADAAYINILGKSLNANYLAWKRIERDVKLYERVGPGDKVIVSGSALPIVNTGGAGK